MELESVTANHLTSQSEDKLHVNRSTSLAWSDQHGSVNDQIGSSPQPKTEEIVCIVTRETKPSGYDVFGLKEVPTDQEKTFQLFCHQAVDLSQELLDEFLVDGIPEYLCSSPIRKVHVVVSTRSGTGLALDFYESVLQTLLKSLRLTRTGDSSDLVNEQTITTARGSSYDLTVTQDVESIRRFAHGLNDLQSEHTVILLSGDGGVVEMLNGKAPKDGAVTPTSTSTPLIAVLPLGTGNALFHSLHKPIYAAHTSSQPSAFVLGLRTLLRGRPAPLPSFSASLSPGSRTITYSNTSDASQSNVAEGIKEHINAVTHLYGAIVASYGFHSQLVWESDTPEYRKHGDKRFGMVAGKLLKESHAYSATVEIMPAGGSSPLKVERAQHAYVLASLVSNLEKTFTISPASQPLDGKLRLVHFGAVGGEKTMEIMMGAYKDGEHVAMKWAGAGGKEDKVGYDEIEEVKVTTLEEDSRWRKICIDGTIVELPQGGSMVVRIEKTSHLQVLVDRSIF